MSISQKLHKNKNGPLAPKVQYTVIPGKTIHSYYGGTWTTSQMVDVRWVHTRRLRVVVGGNTNLVRSLMNEGRPNVIGW